MEFLVWLERRAHLLADGDAGRTAARRVSLSMLNLSVFPGPGFRVREHGVPGKEVPLPRSVLGSRAHGISVFRQQVPAFNLTLRFHPRFGLHFVYLSPDLVPETGGVNPAYA